MATWHFGMTVVGEGGEASVTAKRHVKGSKNALVVGPPFFHGGYDVGSVASFLQFGDDSHDGDLWGHLVPNAEDDPVRLFHAHRDSREATHAHDEEVHPAFLAEFPQERAQRMLRSLGRDIPKRSFAQTGCIPQPKRVRLGLCLPSVTSRAGGDAADIVGGGCGV